MLRMLLVMGLLVSASVSADQNTAFGFNFGTGLELPKCGSYKDPNYDSLNAPTCWKGPNFSELNQLPENGHVSISFARGETPSIARNGFDIYLSNGVLGGVVVRTGGIQDQESVMDMLTKKYGAPTNAIPQVKVNSMGAKVDAIYAEWIRNDVVVKYHSVIEDLAVGNLTITARTVADKLDSDSKTNKKNKRQL